MEPLKTVEMRIHGLGIVFYSPHSAAHIPSGYDFLSREFQDPDRVAELARSCKIVGVSLGSSGKFILKLFSGYPKPEVAESSEFKLRLGVEVKDSTLCVRDLYDFLQWEPVCPAPQMISVQNGFLHLTLLSNLPVSGALGENQEILVYLQELSVKPELKYNGIPTLC